MIHFCAAALFGDNTMGFLAGKRFLVTGLLSSRSIAYGIAGALKREGAELAFTYQGAGVKERVVPLAAEFGSDLVFACDVAKDDEIGALFAQCGRHWTGMDGVVHSIAFAPREALSGSFLDSVSRESFRVAHDISAYSFAALAKAATPMMEGRKAALLTLTYLGAVRSVPNYNVMGLAASLEASVRIWPARLGPRDRVNAVSAGPIKTLAAAGIGGFGKILNFVAEHAPLKRNITIDDVGNAAAFLMSDLASGITGEIVYVDGGFNTVVAGLG
jgi:enoyl-[acyl-carrier protein] reductase I